jgi:hypothetical protein
MSDFTNYPGYDTSGPESTEGERDVEHEEGEVRGRVRAAAGNVAERVRGAGRYFKETDLRGMSTDINDMVRRYPLQSLLIGLGVGYLVGRIRRG